MIWETRLNILNDHLSKKNFVRLAILTDARSNVVNLDIFSKTLNMFLDFFGEEELIMLYIEMNGADNVYNKTVHKLNVQSKIVSSITNSVPNKLN